MSLTSYARSRGLDAISRRSHGITRDINLRIVHSRNDGHSLRAPEMPECGVVEAFLVVGEGELAWLSAAF